MDIRKLKQATALSVEMYGKRIGIVNRLHSSKTVFSFTEEYVADPNRPTMSLSFKGENGSIIPPKLTQSRLPTFFANLLPEGHLRNYLADKLEIDRQEEFFLLAALGDDLSGAVVVRPIEMGIYGELGEKSKEVDNPVEYLEETRLRFSLAGAQLKFSAILESAGGLTIPATGIGGSWIVKLPSREHSQVPENEYVMMNLARAIGLEIPETKLVPVEEIQGLPEDVKALSLSDDTAMALAVKRFDRSESAERTHIEDFAQVFGLFPEHKYGKRSYANIASVLGAESDNESIREFIKRVAYSIVIGNADMHLKNWSLVYKDTISPTLSPAYDLLSIVPYLSEDQLGLSFGDSKSLDEITEDQIRRFVRKARLPSKIVEKAVSEVLERTASAWELLEEKDILGLKLRQAIEKQIMKVTTNSKSI